MKKIIKRYRLKKEIDEILGLGSFMIMFSILIIEILKHIFI